MADQNDNATPEDVTPQEEMTEDKLDKLIQGVVKHPHDEQGDDPDDEVTIELGDDS